MLPKRKIALVGVLVLTIALELAASGFPPPVAAFVVITAGQQEATWGAPPQNAFYAIDPDLNNKLYVEVAPGNYQQGVLVNAIGAVQTAADKWNMASAFHYTYAANSYNPQNNNITNITAGDLSNINNNICRTNSNVTGIWCPRQDANGNIIGGEVVLNNGVLPGSVNTHNTAGNTWEVVGRRDSDVHNLALHELGHPLLIGDHPPGHDEAVMNWAASQKPDLTNDDKQAATLLYGPLTGFEANQAQGYASTNTPNRVAYKDGVTGYAGASIPEMFPIQSDDQGIQPIAGGWHQHIAGTTTSANSYAYFALFSYEDDKTTLANGQFMPLADRRYVQIPANQPQGEENIPRQTHLRWCQRNYQQATMSLDFELDNGETLRGSGLVDLEHGVSVHPAESGFYGTTKFCRTVNLSRFAGRRIVRWFLAYDSGKDNFDVVGQPFRAYFDSIEFLPYGLQGNQVLPIGAGGINPGGPYSYNSLVSFTASASSNWIFTGWRVDGAQAGWANPLSATMYNRMVVAEFAPRPSYCDVPTSHANYNAISQLGARGIIKGYTNGCFGPGDIVQRAQATAFVARAMPSNVSRGRTWDWEDWGNPFSDQNGLVASLWRNVGTLAHYGAASGYDYNSCVARGVAYPCFGPTDQVLEVQVIAYISRSMINAGRWQPVSSCGQYTDVSARQEVCTYYARAGAISFTQINGYQPATRAWFAQQWWQALNAYWSVDNTP